MNRFEEEERFVDPDYYLGSLSSEGGPFSDYFRDLKNGELKVDYPGGVEEEVRIGLLREAVKYRLKYELGMLMYVEGDMQDLESFDKSLLEMARLMLGDQEFEIFEDLMQKIKVYNFDSKGVLMSKGPWDGRSILETIKNVETARGVDDQAVLDKAISDFQKFVCRFSEDDQDPKFAEYLKSSMSEVFEPKTQLSLEDYDFLKDLVYNYMVQENGNYEDLIKNRLSVIKEHFNHIELAISQFKSYLYFAVLVLPLITTFIGSVYLGEFLLYMWSLVAGLAAMYGIYSFIKKSDRERGGYLELFQALQERDLSPNVESVCQNVSRVIDAKFQLSKFEGEIDEFFANHFEMTVSDLKSSFSDLCTDAEVDGELPINSGMTLNFEVDVSEEEVGEEVGAEFKIEV